MSRKPGFILTAILTLATAGIFVFAQKEKIIDERFIGYTVDPKKQDFKLYWKDDKQQNFKSIQNLKTWLEKNHKKLEFAMNAGMYSKAMPVYLRARNRILELAPLLTSTVYTNDTYYQEVYMVPLMAMVRMGKWQEILASPVPEASWRYASLLDAFAKGMAHVHNNNIPAARQCLSGHGNL